jgi:hypothetical protein
VRELEDERANTADENVLLPLLASREEHAATDDGPARLSGHSGDDEGVRVARANAAATTHEGAEAATSTDPRSADALHHRRHKTPGGTHRTPTASHKFTVRPSAKKDERANTADENVLLPLLASREEHAASDDGPARLSGHSGDDEGVRVAKANAAATTHEGAEAATSTDPRSANALETEACRSELARMTTHRSQSL